MYLNIRYSVTDIICRPAGVVSNYKVDLDNMCLNIHFQCWPFILCRLDTD